MFSACNFSNYFSLLRILKAILSVKNFFFVFHFTVNAVILGCWWSLSLCRTAACREWLAVTATIACPLSAGRTLETAPCCWGLGASMEKVWWASSNPKTHNPQVSWCSQAFCRRNFMWKCLFCQRKISDSIESKVSGCKWLSDIISYCMSKSWMVWKQLKKCEWMRLDQHKICQNNFSQQYNIRVTLILEITFIDFHHSQAVFRILLTAWISISCWYFFQS